MLKPSLNKNLRINSLTLNKNIIDVYDISEIKDETVNHIVEPESRMNRQSKITEEEANENNDENTSKNGSEGKVRTLNNKQGMHNIVTKMVALTSVKKVLSLLLILTVCTAFPISAQKNDKGEKWFRGTYEKLYNVKTVETIKGDIVTIDFFAPLNSWNRGIRLGVKTDTEHIQVHVGPEWYMKEIGLSFTKGDRIEIKGSRILFERQSVLIAAEIMMNGNRTVLRNEMGYPVWSKGGRMKQMQ